MAGNNGLPQGWTVTKLKNLVIDNNVTKGSTPTSYGYAYQDAGINFIKTENINSNGIVENITAHIDDEANEFLKRSILQPLDILFSIAGTIGRVGLVQEKDVPANTNQALAIIRCDWETVSNKYLFHLLKSPFIQKQAKDLTVGVGRANLSLTSIKNFDIPFPPLPEQERIVAKIEETFTQLEAGIAELQNVKTQLKRYRAAVLKSAVGGELTREWREAHHGEIEPAEKLLARILEERRKKWETEGRKGKYKEPAAPDTEGLPGLPEGWIWTNFEQLSDGTKHALKAGPFGSSLKKEFYTPMGYKIYGQEQVIRNDPYYGDYYIDDERYKKVITCAVKPGDILISLVGTIGKVLILPDNIEPGIINPRLVKLSLNKEFVYANYTKYYLESVAAKHYFKISSHGGTMEILNLTILRGLPIPLPSAKEQQRIVEMVERRLSVADEIEKEFDESLHCVLRNDEVRG